MSNVFKLIAGRLLIYFGGLLMVLGIVGAYVDYRSLLIIPPVIGIELLMEVVVAILRR